MAFKMKGSPMQRNFPSAFKQDEEKKGGITHTLGEIAKNVFIPGYLAGTVIKGVKSKFGKKNVASHSAEKRRIKTTQDELDEKRNLDYDPQSQR